MKNLTRKASFIAIGAILLTLILFAIPGQFMNMIPESAQNYTMGGYQFFFGGSRACASLQTQTTDGWVYSSVGIALVVLLVLAVVCYAFQKKSSAILLLGGIITFICSIMLFCCRSWIAKAYSRYADVCVGKWVPYFTGAILLLVAAYTVYVVVVTMKAEAKAPYENKKETYSYLKNK